MNSEQPAFSRQPISQNTIVAQVMAHIKELIASGRYRPGDRLPTEQELAALFGVGRSSIREAIKVFQHLGVVESKAAKGTFVQDRANISLEAISWALLLGEDDMLDVFELREAIELKTFRSAVKKVSRGEPAGTSLVSTLKKHVEAMHRAATEGDQDLLAELDYRFHQTIIEGGENRLFTALFHTLHSFLKDEIRRSYYSMSELTEVAEDHADIVRSLENDPLEAAVSRHAQHFSRTRRLLAAAAQEEVRSESS